MHFKAFMHFLNKMRHAFWRQPYVCQTSSSSTSIDVLQTTYVMHGWIKVVSLCYLFMAIAAALQMLRMFACVHLGSDSMLVASDYVTKQPHGLG